MCMAFVVAISITVAVAMVTRDRSLIDEEDELLYGNDNIMVKKEEMKS